jgi:hypothetical protein
MHKKLWLGNLKGRDHSDNLGIEGSIALEGILQKEDGNAGLDSSGSG